KIANTAIGREVSEALAAYSLPVLASTIGQRVIFAEAVANGLAVFEVEPDGSAAQEIKELKTELMEFLK
ncbi:MAG: cobyrinic acid a,c-diamide synthase, partial [Acidocella sp.]|nr:cobyrinic acid a,c-diamide synthase [Acidocella sp.]